jgi:hypothetical protein
VSASLVLVVNLLKYAVAILPSSVVLAAAYWSGASLVSGGANAGASGGGANAAKDDAACISGRTGISLIALVVVSIFSVNGSNNFDSDCCAVISQTLSSIESCSMFLRVLINSCTSKSCFAGSVILRNDMILLNVY